MVKSGLRILMSAVLLVAGLMLAGCGGSGSGGSGAFSSGASLVLAADKTTAASGVDIVSATVTLTSLNSQPVNGVSVSVDMIYNGTVIGTYSGNTNTSGIAVIPVPVALVSTDHTVYLQAKSSGVTSSSSVAVAVKAPILATTLADVTGTITTNSTLTMIFSGANASFKDYYGNSYSSAPVITFTYNSRSGAAGVLTHNGTALNTGDSFSVAPDSSGEALLNLSATLTAPGTAGLTSSTTYNYTISVVYGGLTYTKQGSVNYTLTAS